MCTTTSIRRRSSAWPRNDAEPGGRPGSIVEDGRGSAAHRRNLWKFGPPEGVKKKEVPGVILGTGVDIVEVARLRRALDRHGDRLLYRLFTEAEIAYCNASPPHRAARLAARFAAKEAALKALGLGLRQVRWTDVEVRRDAAGRPSLHLAGRLAALAAEKGATRFHLSLSHTQEYAVAQVVVEA